MFSRIRSHFVDSTEPLWFPCVPLHPYIPSLPPPLAPWVLHGEVILALGWAIAHRCHPMIEFAATGSIEHSLQIQPVASSLRPLPWTAWTDRSRRRTHPTVELEVSTRSFDGDAHRLVRQRLQQALFAVLWHVLVAADRDHLKIGLKPIRIVIVG